MKKLLSVMAMALLVTLACSSNGFSTPVGPDYKPDWAASASFSKVWENGTVSPIPDLSNNKYRFELNNLHFDDYYKTVWFYMEYRMPTNSGFSVERGFAYNDATQGTSKLVSGGSKDLGNGTYAYTYIFEIFPQPDREWVEITTGLFGTTPIAISYADMYSKCDPVPEPTTMLLLGAGCLGLAASQRRFNKA